MNNILLDYNIDYSLYSNINKEFLLKYEIVPLYEEELSILIATSKTNIDIEILLDKFKKPIKLIYANRKDILSHLQFLDLKVELYQYAIQSLEDTHKNNENSFIINFVDKLFSFCIDMNVSDIHFESLEQSVIIRVRIDGELNQIFRFSLKLFALLSSIIKYFGNLDISQRRIPLNGRFTREINSLNYDLRISTLPTVYGESIVLRILDNQNIQKNLNDIGFDEDTLQIIQKNISLTQGLILVTGPTGSGKTTSLYSMLNSLNTKNKKIITIEDPVEYKLDGVMQVNINNDINLNYQIVLKNILRQDPDILLIGEIRDFESLQIAIQASLTGHLVIATLHTNNAIETINRLLDLKAEPYLISSTLKMILSQRLLRKLCIECKSKIDDTDLYEANGCKNCNYTGYQSRKVIAEVLQIDNEISRMITKKNNIHNIKEYVTKNNFNFLEDIGLSLVNKGITTSQEFYSKV